MLVVPGPSGDAQCPRDVKFMSGKANLDRSHGSCCAEMEPGQDLETQCTVVGPNIAIVSIAEKPNETELLSVHFFS